MLGSPPSKDKVVVSDRELSPVVFLLARLLTHLALLLGAAHSPQVPWRAAHAAHCPTALSLGDLPSPKPLSHRWASNVFVLPDPQGSVKEDAPSLQWASDVLCASSPVQIQSP